MRQSSSGIEAEPGIGGQRGEVKESGTGYLVGQEERWESCVPGRISLDR